jgi:hypothetical protein
MSTNAREWTDRELAEHIHNAVRDISEWSEIAAYRKIAVELEVTKTLVEVTSTHSLSVISKITRCEEL